MTEGVNQLLRVFGVTGSLVLAAFLVSRVNLKRRDRYAQFLMPIVALIYCIVAMILFNKLYILAMNLLYQLPDRLIGTPLERLGVAIYGLLSSLSLKFWITVICNVLILLAFMIVKAVLLPIVFGIGKKGYAVTELVYEQDSTDDSWCLRKDLLQCRTFAKTLYFASVALATVMLLLSKYYYNEDIFLDAFSPALCVIVVGEVYFFLDGKTKEEEGSSLAGEDDNARRIVNNTGLRKALRKLFGDKLAADNTTYADELSDNGSKDALLEQWEQSGDSRSESYAVFMRAMVRSGAQIDTNYMISGHDLLMGKNILFSNPFYSDLIPYAFFAMNRTLMRCKKVLVILGRHGMEENITKWCTEGLETVTNVPALWHIGVMGQCEEEPEVAIMRAADVCNLPLHEQYAGFLSQVEFVVMIEPSRLIPTAQIGLNSVVHHCTADGITFCSTDKNCDGLVDALSHILMTSISEVSATGHHSGICSYMCWECDQEMLQHRIFPNVSHYLGMGTELSFAALKNQVSSTAWYGGDAFPVSDMRWIAKQYYYDLLHYAALPPNQDLMSRCFQVSPDLYAADVRDARYLTVEDEAFNMFEVKRSFATRARNQSFINVISSDYLLREYMADNNALFDTDPKAIPYLVADYARTIRNVTLRLCLRMCVGAVCEDDIRRELSLVGVNADNPIDILWAEICKCYQPMDRADTDDIGRPVMIYRVQEAEYRFTREVLREKRVYSIKKGVVENSYFIEDRRFGGLLLNDLRCAEYIAEDETGKQQYIGSELCGHIYQRHLPGQFFTIFGRYYEMAGMTADGKVLLRRAADYINGRPFYRQVRRYVLQHTKLADRMGARREVAGMRIDHCLADILVETGSYWQMNKYSDFESARFVSISGIRDRRYCRKNILRIDFSQVEGYSRAIGITLTVLLNEVFRTLFAENQAYIVAAIPGEFQKPLTYSLCGTEDDPLDENCIYLIEDSQMDIGLLVAVERNLDRILSIITDYLDWHLETLENSLHPQEETPPAPSAEPAPETETEETEEHTAGADGKKRTLLQRIGDFFRRLFKKKGAVSDGEATEPEKDAPAGEEAVVDEGETAAQPEAPAAKDSDVDAAADAPIPAEESAEEPAEEPADDPAVEQAEGDDAPAENAQAAEDTEKAESPEEAAGSPALMSRGSMRLFTQSGDHAENGDIGEETGENTDLAEQPNGVSENAQTGEAMAEPETEAKPEAKDGVAGQLIFEEARVMQPSVNIQRAPYHERYFLLFGGTELPDCLAVQETFDFLKAYGCDNGTLKQARKGRNMAEIIEQTYQPGKAGAHYCDFCGVELLGTEYDVLSDGRERCTNCSRTSVKTAEEFKRIYENVVRNMDIFYGVRQEVPVRIEMVNAKKLHRRLGETFVPTGNADGRTLGVAIRSRKGDYSILIENGAPRMSSTMTMVHELTHIWQYEHWNREKISAQYGAGRTLEIYEGMAKWSELQYAYLVGETATAKREEIITRLRKDEYGIGFLRYAEKYPLSYETQLQGDTPFMYPDMPL